ncbi:MAG: M13 family metallopeptidase [Bacteroides sp.]|nr:M13 family metallopeptidase [Bacteroides sp.]MBD5306028.1 M13 family metallopeptidase [Bacteroides sp.]
MMVAAAAPHGIDKANLNPAVSPAQDFYLYACGGWMENHPLTPEFSRFGTFDQLRENARLQLQELITGLEQNPESKVKGTNAQKVADLYALGMDSVRLNKEGAAPLLPYLEKINSMERKDFADIVSWMHDGVTSSFFGTGVGADAKNSDVNILHIGEVGLGLGDRDYYLEENETNERILKAYREYIAKVMELAGYSPQDAKRVSDNVVKMETEFARNKMTREERRNPQARYNIRTIDQIRTDYPNFDWDRYFSNMNISGVDKANVVGLSFMKFLNDYLPTLSLQEIKDYLAFEFVSESSTLLSDPFNDANFEMFGRIMSGTEEQQPRWKRAMAIPNSMLGEAVGELYVSKYFPEENKNYMKGLVENLRVALGQHIDSLSWMSDTTKEKAHGKLDTFTVKIGYPDKWKDYSAISIDPEKSYLENVLTASQWFTRDNFAKLDKPVDKTEWHMTPQTVNAYYNPTTNEICFPAGILQAPYFDLSADDAQNYGAIGVVIGHEMTHGFDDQGRQYDPAGNLNDWWTEEDAAKFTALADKLVAQFDAVEVAPGVHANGRFTLGENIADQGGLRVALTAYLNSMKDKEMNDIDGFSPLQRFYLAYANLWAGNIRDEEVLARTKTDPHSLGSNRVNVSLRNIEPFFNAFSIKEGDPMFRPEEERVVIW